MPARLIALIVKEFLAILRDRRSRLVLVGPPVIQLFLFAYAATFDVEEARLAVLNEDRSREARELVARFDASRGFAVVERLTHVSQIAPRIDAQDVVAVLHLGPEFSANLKRRGAAEIQIVVDGRRSNTALVLLGYTAEIVADYTGELAAAHGLPGPPAELVTRAWFNPQLDSRWFIVPGLVGTLTLVVTTVVAGLSVARERELGTFEQLLVTPLRPFEILIGKTVPALGIGLVEGAFIAAMAVLWFGVPLRGSPVLLAVALVVFLLSAIGVGLMISALAHTQQQAIVGSFLFLMPAVILSGFATPIENMPPFVQVLTYADPLRYMLVILRGAVPARPAGRADPGAALADGGDRRGGQCGGGVAVPPAAGLTAAARHVLLRCLALGSRPPLEDLHRREGHHRVAILVAHLVGHADTAAVGAGP